MSPQARTEYVQRLLIVVGVIGLALGAALLLWRAADLLLFAFAGILLAGLLTSVAAFFQRLLKLAYGWALTLTVILLVVLLGVSGWLIGASVAAQIGELAESLPELLQNAEAQLRQYPWAEPLLNAIGEPGTLMPGEALVPQVASTAGSIGSGVARLLLVVFVGLFVAASPQLYQRGLVSLVPRRGRARAREVTDELGVTIRNWLLGQIISMAIIGAFTSLGLWLLGMPMALTLGVLAGLMEFVPFIGPVIAAVPALLLALSLDPMQTLYVLLLYVVVQQLEGNVVMPLVHRRTVHLPPALTIVAVLVMERLFGLVGMFVATPLLAVVMVLVKMLYLHDAVGETVELPGGVVED